MSEGREIHRAAALLEAAGMVRMKRDSQVYPKTVQRALDELERELTDHAWEVRHAYQAAKPAIGPIERDSELADRARYGPPHPDDYVEECFRAEQGDGTCQ